VSWASAVPDVLVCVGLFFAPGLLVTYLGGLRSITAWATAPLVTVATVAGVAVLGGWFNFRFGVWPVAAGTVVMGALAAALSLLLRARGAGQPPRDPGPYSLAVIIGAVVAALIGVVTFVTGVRRPDAISETYDAVYHYNAIRYIEQTGKASPLTIGTLGQPSSHARFYPDAWHTMAALVAELTGASIPVAATVTCLVIAVLIWPLGCLLLARHLFGNNGTRATAAVVITGLVSSLFGAFPWMMTGWGVLWPNALGMALAPAGVALGLSILRISDGDTFGAQRWLFAILAAWAIGIAHPNSALSVAVICLIPVLMAIGPYVVDQWKRHTLRTALVLIGLVAVVVIGVALAWRLPPIRHVEAQNWAVIDTPGYAVVSTLSNSTNGQPSELLLASFTFIGMIVCFVWRQRRWLVGAQLIFIALYVGSAAIGWRPIHLITGLWYDDSHRLAAVLPIVTIPLTTIGVLAVGEWLLQALPQVASRATLAARPAVALGVPLAMGTLLAAATASQSVANNANTVGHAFSTSGDLAFVSPEKAQFLATVADVVPRSALVADDPFSGTAYLYTLSGTHVLFPQVDPDTNNSNTTYLAQNLVDIDKNSRACALVRRYGVGYLVVAPDDYLPKQRLPGPYSGVDDPGRDSGFRLIRADGPLKLYKITICQPSSHSAAPIETASGGSG
jgi:hypothetical protein